MIKELGQMNDSPGLAGISKGIWTHKNTAPVTPQYQSKQVNYLILPGFIKFYVHLNA